MVFAPRVERICTVVLLFIFLYRESFKEHCKSLYKWRKCQKSKNKLIYFALSRREGSTSLIVDFYIENRLYKTRNLYLYYQWKIDN
jgi:hypothetical protein